LQRLQLICCSLDTPGPSQHTTPASWPLTGEQSTFWDDYRLGTAADYRFLGKGGDSMPQDMDQRAAVSGFIDLVKTMEKLAFETSEMLEVMRVLAIVLHVGNVEFASSHDGERVVIPLSKTLEDVAALASVPAANLEMQLCTSTTVTRGEKINKFKTLDQAEDGRDSMAKAMYGRLFAWLVAKLNANLESNAGKEWFEIGVLDIFGFENHAENSLEQLCINVVGDVAISPAAPQPEPPMPPTSHPQPEPPMPPTSRPRAPQSAYLHLNSSTF
jgi:myosin heavy subunit